MANLSARGLDGVQGWFNGKSSTCVNLIEFIVLNCWLADLKTLVPLDDDDDVCQSLATSTLTTRT